MPIEKLRFVSLPTDPELAARTAEHLKDFKCPGPSCRALHVVVIQGEVQEELSVVVVAKS